MQIKWRNLWRRWSGLGWWGLFAAGLIVQVGSPHLKISNRAFVIPPSLSADGNSITPDKIVKKERRIQLISALLTLGGALGLAFHYREALMGRASREVVKQQATGKEGFV